MPTLELADWKAYYQESGVGLGIVFIPGITEYKESFQFQLRGLSDRYRVISYDVRTSESGAPIGIQELSKDLGNLMDGLRVPSAVIVGHCFGGLIAQHFAMEHPDRTTALVLMSTFAKAPDQNHAKLLRYMSSGHQDDPDSAIEKLKDILGLRPPKVYDEDDHLDWVVKQSAKTSPTAIQSRINMAREFDSRPWLDQLWMPLLLLVGQHDRPAFLSAAQMMQRATPDSTLEVIDGAGHFPHIERHDLVNYYIDDFVGTRLTSLIE